MKPATWRLTAAAASLTALIAGSRASFGMFLSPLNTATGLGMAALGLAAAIGQLAAGFALPVVDALARRFGSARVISAGACALAMATALLAIAHTLAAVVFVLLVVFAAGTAVANNALLIGEVSRHTEPADRGLVSGFIGAGGPTGQLLMAPVVTLAIATHGWTAALCGLAVAALLALPLARSFPKRRTDEASRDGVAAGRRGDAMRDLRFWLVAGSFAMCGFHVSFLAVHMPGVIERCGLPASVTGWWLVVAGAANVAGSLGVGVLMKRFASAPLLAVIYALRVAAIVAFVAVPPSAAAVVGFALAMGLTYMAALPPTAELIARAFGVERLSALLGATMLIHQIGGFFGAWLGGVAVEHAGGYLPLWIVDASLAAVAAGLQLVLMRRRPAPAPAPRATRPAPRACAATRERRTA